MNISAFPFADLLIFFVYETETLSEVTSARFWGFTQRILVVCYRRFGTTYRSPY
jgi:hypothetical protein